ncbi:MAG: hypothetical protein VXZ63_00825, partial [Planctomycetota bacterium]|nr:hypothetical protein [Planctomycetota bacterium]
GPQWPWCLSIPADSDDSSYRPFSKVGFWQQLFPQDWVEDWQKRVRKSTVIFSDSLIVPEKCRGRKQIDGIGRLEMIGRFFGFQNVPA